MTRDLKHGAMFFASGPVAWAGWESFFHAATTVTGFVTGLAGMVMGVCGAIWWARRLVSQRRRELTQRRKEAKAAKAGN